MFRAGIDGEYWFLVRTLDRAGQLHPDGPSQPGLKVLVDSTPPKVQLQARRGPTGEVVIGWRVEEPYPKPSSMSLRYRAGPDAPWQPITLERPAPGPEGPVQSGELSLFPPANLAKMELRAEVLDLAGNMGFGQVQVQLNARRRLPSPRSTHAHAAGEAENRRCVACRSTRPAADALAAGQRRFAGPSGRQPSRRCTGKASGTLGGAKPVALGTQPGAAANRMCRRVRCGLRWARGQCRWPTRATRGHRRPGKRPEQFAAASSGVRSAKSAAAPASGPSGWRSWGDSTTSCRRANAREWSTRGCSSCNTMFSRSAPRASSRSSSGVRGNNGRTWNRVAADSKPGGPMIVTVAEEGTYGYRMVVQSGAGWAASRQRVAIGRKSGSVSI